jgi:hypothetical protein
MKSFTAWYVVFRSFMLVHHGVKVCLSEPGGNFIKTLYDRRQNPQIAANNFASLYK